MKKQIKKNEKDEDEDIINSYEAQKCPEHLKQYFKNFIKYHAKIKPKLYSFENKNHENYKTNENNENKINNINNISNSNSMQSKENSNSIISDKTNNNISINNTKKNGKKLVYIKNYSKKKDNNKFFLLSDGTKQIFFLIESK